MRYVHTTEYCQSTLKKKKRKQILTLASTWMNLEVLVLRDTSPSQRDKGGGIPLRAATFMETERGLAATRAGGRAVGPSQDRRRVSVVKRDRVLEAGFATRRTCRTLLNCPCKKVQMLHCVLHLRKTCLEGGSSRLQTHGPPGSTSRRGSSARSPRTPGHTRAPPRPPAHARCPSSASW